MFCCNLRESKENVTRQQCASILFDEFRAFDLNIDWDKKYYPSSKKGKFHETISGGRLPKFNSLKDNFNGMGITVHDTWSTHIIIKSLQIKKMITVP